MSGNAWRRHPSRSFLCCKWDGGTRTAAPKREDGAGPGDEAEGCPRSQSAIRRDRGRQNQLVDKQ